MNQTAMPRLFDFRAIVEVGEWIAKLVNPRQSMSSNTTSSTLGMTTLPEA